MTFYFVFLVARMLKFYIITNLATRKTKVLINIENHYEMLKMLQNDELCDATEVP